MKVAFIAACPFVEDRGTPLRIYGLAKAISGQGVEVHVITYHLGRDAPGLHIHRIRKNAYKKTGPGPSWFKPILDILVLWKTIRVVKKNDIKVIVGSHFEGGFIGYAAAKLLGRKIIFDAHASLADELVAFKFLKRKSFRYRFFSKLEKFLVRHADAIAVDSGLLGNHFQALGAAPERITVVPTGISEEDFSLPPEEVKAIRSTLCGKKTMVLYTGTLAPYQGLDILLESFAEVQKRKKDLHLVVVGGTLSEIESYKERAGKLGITAITFAGKVPFTEIPKYLLAADVLVAPRLEDEGTALQRATKILSYMAAGKPIIATRIKAHTCTLNEETAFLVKPNDKKELSEALIEVAGNLEKSKGKGGKAMKKVVEEYSWTPIGKTLREVIAKFT